jgi:hypothetical protein
MMRLTWSAVLVSLMLSRCWAQTNQTSEPPKQVVERYLKMVADGELLTPDGWTRVNSLVSPPSPQPTDGRIFVTSTHRGVGEISVKDNRAEVHDAWWDELGSIDSSLRYTPSKAESNWNIGVYHLILTDKHWGRGADGVMKEVTGPPEWKIEGPLTKRWATVEAAIRYVQNMRDNSSDLSVKQNADKTITALRSYVKQTN